VPCAPKLVLIWVKDERRSVQTGGNNLWRRTVSIPKARDPDTPKMEVEMPDRATCSSALQIALPLAGPLLAFLIMIVIR
jgi:hypothetical protein